MDREWAVIRGAQTVLHETPGLSREEALVIGEAIAEVVILAMQPIEGEPNCDTAELIGLAQEAARDWVQRNCA